MKYNLAPSLLSANFANLEKDIKELEEENIEYLHLDVMDGLFVPNISYGSPVIKSIRKTTNMIFDTHLMIEKPYRYVKQFKDAGSDIFTFHYEACSENEDDENSVSNTIKKIKQENMKVGISIKPKTDAIKIHKYLKDIDLVLVMSVEPGFSGQKFIESALAKIQYYKTERSIQKLNYIIEVDGGINKDNIKSVLSVGADLVVAGSAIFGSNIKENINKLKI